MDLIRACCEKSSLGGNSRDSCITVSIRPDDFPDDEPDDDLDEEPDLERSDEKLMVSRLAPSGATIDMPILLGPEGVRKHKGLSSRAAETARQARDAVLVVKRRFHRHKAGWRPSGFKQ
jgi:hypothetical protein